MEEKESQARKIVNRHMWFSMGVGLLPFPLLDMAAITGLQLRMLHQLSELYGVLFAKDLGQKLISSLLGSVVPLSLTSMMGSIVKFVPVVGSIVGGLSLPIFSGASTYAIGKIFIQHFEAGGTFLTFDPAKVREHFRQEFEKGQTLATDMQSDSNANP